MTLVPDPARQALHRSRSGDAKQPPFNRDKTPVYPYVVIGILMLASTLSFMDRTILTLVVDPLKRAFSLGDTQIGVLAGFAFALFYSVMGVPLGRIADVGNRRWLIITGVAGWSVATAACGLAKGFGSLFVARALVGVGEAALAPAAYSLIANYFPRAKLGFAMSLLAVGITLGNGAAVTLGGLIVRWSQSNSLGLLPGIGVISGWRLAFLVVAALGAPVTVMLLAVREPARESATQAGENTSLREIIAYIRTHARAFIGVYVGYPLVVVMSFAQLLWGPTYFIRVLGYSTSKFGVIYGLMIGLGGTCSLLIGGIWSDFLWRRGRLDAPMRLILASVILQAPFLIAAFLCPQPTWAMVFFSIGVVVLCINGGLQGATLQILSPERMRGRIAALYLIVANLVGGGLGPMVTGLMTQHLFGGPMGLGRSLATLAAVTLSLAAIVLAWALKPLRQSAQRLLDLNGPAPFV